MNKLTLIARRVVLSLKIFTLRGLCLLRGQKYDNHPGPQWQQLELPFTRTPVRRWNR